MLERKNGRVNRGESWRKRFRRVVPGLGGRMEMNNEGRVDVTCAGDIKKKDDGSKCEIKYVGDIVIDHRSSFIYLLHLSFA